MRFIVDSVQNSSHSNMDEQKDYNEKPPVRNNQPQKPQIEKQRGDKAKVDDTVSGIVVMGLEPDDSRVLFQDNVIAQERSGGTISLFSLIVSIIILLEKPQ